MPLAGCAAPSPAVHTTNVTWQVQVPGPGCYPETLGTVGKEDTFAFNLKINLGIKQLAFFAG